MKPLLLIVQREYYSRIKKKSFIVMTALIPFLAAGMLFVPLFLSQIKDPETKRIIVIDHTGLYFPHLKTDKNYIFESVSENAAPETRTQIGKEIFGMLQISENLNYNPKGAAFISEKQAPSDLINYIERTLSSVSKEDRLNNYTQSLLIDTEIVKGIQTILESKNNISVATVRLDQDGTEKETSRQLASGMGFTLIIFMYMFIMTYGAMVLQGVVEEKTNRIVEVMISSVRPFYLMIGKIIGIGLVGFTQFLIWILVAVIFFSIGSSAASAGSPAEINTVLSLLPEVNWLYIISFFILFFIGGYLMYASIFAMFASSVDNAQDTQQFVMPITLIFIFALYAGIYSVQNPDGPLAFWCSLIPFTSPIVMMVRIPAEIPLWEIALSLVILYTTVILTVKLAAKIYRIGILMYGKKPGLKELYKWSKYK